MSRERAAKGRRNAGKTGRDYLEPITSKIRRKRFATYDLESKKDEGQEAGFERPFVVGFFDPHNVRELEDGYEEFWNEPHLKHRQPWRERHQMIGGCIDKFMRVALTEQYAGYVFYAHNGGNFDHLFLLPWLEARRDEFGFEIVPIQSTIQVLRVWRVPVEPDEEVNDEPSGGKRRRKEKRLVWEFLDSMRLLPFGLAKACKTFGVPGKIDTDLDRHEDDRAGWSEYLKQDCVALAGVMSRLYDLIENRFHGEVGITTPATAMKLFRRRYLGRDGVQKMVPRYAHWQDCPSLGGEAGEQNAKNVKNASEKVPTCDGCAHEWIRRGYYGGRTEIFRTYGTRLHYYDINSSYVAAMQEDMPIGDRIVETTDKIDWGKHRSHGGTFSGFAECSVYVPPSCPIPPLPHRDAVTGKLLFPAGTFHGVWSLEELALLFDPIVGGSIVRVDKVVWFKLKPMFGRMVEDLWALRAKTVVVDGEEVLNPEYDEGLDALAKLLGNSSYGKFCMRQERTTVVFRRETRRDEAGLPETCFLCGERLVDPGRGDICPACEGSTPATPEPEGDVWYQAKKVDAPYIIPHIGAHITALARVRLWRYMKAAVTTPSVPVWTDEREARVTVREERRAGEGERGPLYRVEAEGYGLEVSDEVTAGDEGEAWKAFLDRRRIRMGDVVFFPNDRPSVVVRIDRRERGRVRAELLVEGPDGRGIVGSFVLPKVVRMGGRIYYVDTDSVVTDIVLPSSKALGLLKDEYPGELLDFVAVQPKVYMIEKTRHNAEVRRLRQEARAAGVDPDLRDARGRPVRPDLQLEYKVTMKGFPMRLRTRENLERLQAGETLYWDQLEKVRSLARGSFKSPPRMAGPDGFISKSFQSRYDKRIVLEDGGTTSRVLDERVERVERPRPRAPDGDSVVRPRDEVGLAF